MNIASRLTQVLGIVGTGLIAWNAIMWLTAPITGFGLPEGGNWSDFRFTTGELIAGALGIVFLTVALDNNQINVKNRDNGHLIPARSLPSRRRRVRDPNRKKRL